MIAVTSPAVEHAMLALLGRHLNERVLTHALNVALRHASPDELRHTTVGQQLLREGQEQGWTECADHVALHAVGLGHTMLSKNPYRMEEK